MIKFLLSPTGRISGTRFLSSIAVAMLIMLIIGFGLGTLPSVDGPIILSVCWVLLAWPLLCLFIKRLHDTGRSAAWLWLLIPQGAMALSSLAMSGYLSAAILWLMTMLGVIANILCWGLIFFLALKPGDEGDNAYGTDPRATRDGITADCA